MGKFSDIITTISGKANELGKFYYKSIFEFANVTQENDGSEVLIFLNPDGLPGNYEIPSRVLTSFDIDLWFIKQHNLEGSDLDISVVQDQCLTVATQFLYELSQTPDSYFPLENSSFRMVKYTTPNAFAGVRLIFKIKTACNL